MDDAEARRELLAVLTDDARQETADVARQLGMSEERGGRNEFNGPPFPKKIVEP